MRLGAAGPPLSRPRLYHKYDDGDDDDDNDDDDDDNDDDDNDDDDLFSD